jgi:hypothetical protein
VTQPPILSRSGAQLYAGSSYDPSSAGGAVAWQRPSGEGVMRRRGGAYQVLPGTHPALGGDRIAWREGSAIVVADASSLRQRERIDAPGAGVLDVSDDLLAWRARDALGADRIWVAAPGNQPRLLLELAAPQELGRPALLGGRLLTHVAGPEGSSIIAVDLATGAQELLREEPGAQLSNPATDGSRLLYVHATGRAQELRLGPLEPTDADSDRVLLVHPSSGRRDREHEHGRRRHRHLGGRPQLPPRAQPGVVDTVWTTALTGASAYFTRIRARTGRARTADILRVPIAA